jgi:prolyl-tRNA editing enzyme YbaK/EbsC (Cys-tRNA(Pro) deacylase)
VAQSWPEPVERVVSYLRNAGAEARVEEFPAGTPTAQDAADAVGCELSRIVKSILFECAGQPVLVMVPGDRRADPRRIASAVGAERAKIASPERVREITGFEPGAVAPFPIPRVDRALIDRRLLTADRVWIGAGSTRHMAGLKPAELARLARATPVDVASDD